MMQVKHMVWGLVSVAVMGIVGCGGGSGEKSLSMWKITKENRKQTYSAVLMSIDDYDKIYHFDKISRIDQDGAIFKDPDCLIVDGGNTLVMNQCEIKDGNKTIKLNGKRSYADNRITFDNLELSDNYYIKEAKIQSGYIEVVGNGNTIDDYKVHEITLQAEDKYGNRLEWKRFSSYQNKDGEKIIKGLFSSSIIENKWIKLELSKNFDSSTKPYWMKISGKDNSNMKIEYTPRSGKDEKVDVFVNGEKVDTFDGSDAPDDFRDEYDIRNELLNK